MPAAPSNVIGLIVIQSESAPHATRTTTGPTDADAPTSFSRLTAGWRRQERRGDRIESYSMPASRRLWNAASHTVHIEAHLDRLFDQLQAETEALVARMDAARASG